jgi:tetratricopeptide (TPR) repeat protein
LPKEISSKELSDTMKGFALGLGVRCETCHVGEAGKPLDTFDFDSDDKAMKRKARIMVQMLADVNSVYVPQLNEIEDAKRVEVRCVTCHRGRPQPKLIEDELDEQLADAGVEAALARYAELRENFYGSHSYDFSEFTLPMYVQQLAAREQLDVAITVLQLNVENFPQSYYTQFVLAELNSAADNTAAAIVAYTKAMELNPRAAPFLEAKIAALKD